MMKKHRKTARPASPDWFEIEEKILIHQVGGSNIKAYLDKERYYATISTILIRKLNDKLNLRYLLAIINSSLIRYWYKKQAVTSTVKLSELRRIPIFDININDSKQSKIYAQLITLVDKIQELFKKENKMEEHTDSYNNLKKKIKEVNENINDNIFRLYGLTDKEKSEVLNIK